MNHVRGAAAKSKVHFAREQRQAPTRGEQLLWGLLRGGRLGAKFRRQHPFDDFVLDFYCEIAHLAVEIDGPDHAERAGYDAWRDEQLAHRGIRVLRITADEVVRDPQAAIAQVIAALQLDLE